MSKVEFLRDGVFVASGPQIMCPTGDNSSGECIPGSRRSSRKAIVAVDLFAGAGGFTEGAEAAGAHVVFAINHYVNSISAHILNHPETTHCCESVFAYDPIGIMDIVKRATGSRIPDLVLASPSCKVTSRARTNGAGVKGDKANTPQDDALRATPGAVADVITKLHMEALATDQPMPFLVVENVAEFSTWGYKPKGSKKPDGSLYRYWKQYFEISGYHPGEEHILQGLDFGSSAERRRMFLIFTPLRYDRPFRLDMRGVKNVMGSTSAGEPYRGFDARYTKSVPRRNQLGNFLKQDFKRVGAGGWRSVAAQQKAKRKGWGPRSKSLIAKAKKRNGGKVPEYWTWSYTDNAAPRFLQDPQRTLTSAMGGQLYVMHRDKHFRMCHPVELGMWNGFPRGYVLPKSATEAGTLIGNAVVPSVSEFVISQILEVL